MSATLLIVDDELSIRELLQILFEQDGYRVLVAKSAEEGLRLLSKERVDLILSDLNLPQKSGIELLQIIKSKSLDVEFIIMTAYGSTENAIEAMKEGAANYVLKPFNNDELRLVVQRALGVQALAQENKKLREDKKKIHFGYLVGSSPAMQGVYELIRRVKDSKINCLIAGESGTGKEMVARSIHHNGVRKDFPFVAINCGAIPENLVESELFGHKRGSFTGAIQNKIGLIKAASQGTLFLDEVDALPLNVQVKLLRVLQEKKFIPVGEIKEEEVDIRLIAACNRDLESLVREGKFRDDLYYRLNVVEIALPPLRERGEDILELARFFMGRYSREYGKQLIGIAPEALSLLKGLPYAGNVRELQNLMERAVALSVGNILRKEDFPKNLSEVMWEREGGEKILIPDGGINFEALMSDFEKRWLQAAMKKSKGKKGKAAELLQMTFRSFRYRLAKYGME